MMGHEHYAKAQQLLTEADVDLSIGNFEEAARVVATAQAHATLALAAATVDTALLTRTSYVNQAGNTVSYVDDPSLNRWIEVTS